MPNSQTNAPMPSTSTSLSIRPLAVVFDLGKVLLDFDFGIAAAALSSQSAHSPRDVLELINQTPLLHAYESGKLTTEAFFQTVRSRIAYRGTPEEFESAFANIFTEIPPMLAMHRRLIEMEIPCFIFSNTNDIAMRHIRRTYGFFKDFSDHILSYEHGTMKPDPAIYEVVEQRTGCAPHRLLYLDDREENIETARQRGWNVIHHSDPETSCPLVWRFMEAPNK